MADDTERLRAWQTKGYADGVLLRADVATVARAGTPEHDAYLRGFAGEPPPCGCVAVLRAEEARRRKAAREQGNRLADLDDIAADAMWQARAALGDTEAVE